MQPIEATDQSADTHGRILVAATITFAERGFEGATLKEITDRAGANIAAVNYYFRSKDELFRHVLRRLLEKVNAARALALQEYEAAVLAGEQPALYTLLEAMIRPMVQLGTGAGEGVAHLSLLLQARFSPSAPDDISFPDNDLIHERFIDALGRMLPHLSRKEIIWRYDCTRGAMMFVLADLSPSIHRIVRLAQTQRDAEVETVVRELVAFAAQGFLAASAGTPLSGR